jgi:hypothetical protein
MEEFVDTQIDLKKKNLSNKKWQTS